VLFLAAACATQPSTPTDAPAQPAATAQPAASKESEVERGRYLVQLGGCNDCHSPKVGADLDTKRILSGQPADEKLAAVPKGLIAPDKWGTVANNHLTAWVGPWGVSFAANLTPDKATGLGNWTPAMFLSSLRSGKNPVTGRAILPPMPWFMYKDLKEEDLRAIFAYLQSLPPINNPVPPPLPPEQIPR
jgi:mono/diheme cytochrome c family protein